MKPNGESAWIERTVLGAAMMVSCLGMAFGPLAGGWVFDRFNTYTCSSWDRLRWRLAPWLSHWHFRR